MSTERRNDLGGKLLYGILTAIIVWMLTNFFGDVKTKAEDSIACALENKASISVLQERLKKLDEIAVDVKTLIRKIQ